MPVFLDVFAQHCNLTEDVADCQPVEPQLKKTDVPGIRIGHLDRDVYADVHSEPLISCYCNNPLICRG